MQEIICLVFKYDLSDARATIGSCFESIKGQS